MSRADDDAAGSATAAREVDGLPEGPRLGGSVRLAAFDFYFHSIRLVAANVIWGVGFLTVFGLIVAGLPLVGLIGAVLLAVPWVGVVRLAALIVRNEDVVLSDAFDAYRAYLAPALLGGLAIMAAGLVFFTNVALGLQAGGVAGWSFATLAAWGFAATWTVALCFWPLVVDPRRNGRSTSEKLRLALTLALASPGRLGALAALAALLSAVSTVAAAAILTISVAFVALLTCRYVLPAADRLESRLGIRPAPDPEAVAH